MRPTGDEGHDDDRPASNAGGIAWAGRKTERPTGVNAKEKSVDELVAAISVGDRSAFDTLYRRLERPLYRFLILKLNDPHRSSDLLHDVFLEVWRSAATFRGQSKAQTWIFAIAWRKAMEVHRKGERVTYQESLPDQIDESPDAATALSAAEDATAVQACLKGLSEEHRMVLELTFFEEMSYPDIGAVMGIPEGTVKSRVYHAKQLMLRCLSAKGAVRGSGRNG